MNKAFVRESDNEDEDDLPPKCAFRPAAATT
jgi:hypothetical protein